MNYFDNVLGTLFDTFPGNVCDAVDTLSEKLETIRVNAIDAVAKYENDETLSNIEYAKVLALIVEDLQQRFYDIVYVVGNETEDVELKSSIDDYIADVRRYSNM